MTERALPLGRDGARHEVPGRHIIPPAAEHRPRLLPDPPRPRIDGREAPGQRATAAPRTAVRPAAATRRPVHVAVAVGVSAGLYAASLAGVTALQSGTDARLAAERAPAADAVNALRAHNDQLDADLARIGGGYSGAATTYQAIADAIAGNEASLAGLASLVKSVEGSAAALKIPTISRLPTVSSSSSRTVYVSSRPVTNACTTASGKPC